MTDPDPDPPSGPTRTFPGGFARLAEQLDRRQVALKYRGDEALPPPDCDLAAIAARRVPDPLPQLPEGSSSFARKWHAIALEMQGQSELGVLHGVLVANLRKRRYPAQAPALFRRLWAEQADALLAQLSTRWLISAAITFAEVGETETDRSLGQSFNILFSVMKLYEAERLYSGLPPETPFKRRDRIVAPLPMEMPNFALVEGDLEANLLAPLWRAAQEAPGIGPLARALLDRLDRDPGTLFRRLALLRAAKPRRKPPLP